MPIPLIPAHPRPVASVPPPVVQSAASSVIELPFYDGARNALVVPYNGAAPAYHLQVLDAPPRLVYVIDASPNFRGIHTGATPDALNLNRWIAESLAHRRVRVTLFLDEPARIYPVLDATRHQLLFDLHNAIDRPVVSSGPPRSPWGGSAALVFGSASYAEHFPTGDVLTSIDGVPLLGARVRAHARPPWLAGGPAWLDPECYLELGFENESYAFIDRSLPLSVHTRNEFSSEAIASRRVQWRDLQANVGLGYGVRAFNALHSGAPPGPSYAFAASRLIHGPELALDGAWGPQPSVGGWLGNGLRGWRLFAAAAAMPLVNTQVDVGLPTPPIGLAGRVRLGLAKAWGPLSVAVSYRYQGAWGNDYLETLQGPAIELGWSLDR